MTNETRRKLILVACSIGGLGVLVLLAWPLLEVLVLSGMAHGTTLFSHVALWSTLGICAGIIAGAVILVVWILPLMLFVLRKLFFYLSLWWICLCSKKKCRWKRVPFASLFRVSSRSDVTIKTTEGKLYLHLIDIVFPRRRALTFPTTSEYVVTPVVVSRISKNNGRMTNLPNMNGAKGRTGVVRATGQSLLKGHDRVKALPMVDEGASEKHLLVTLLSPSEVRFVKGGSTIPLASGEKIGSFIYCSFPFLKKALQGKLHGSLFDEKGKYRDE